MDGKEYTYPRRFLFNVMPIMMMYAIVLMLLPTAILKIIDIVMGHYIFSLEGIFDLIVIVLSPLVFTILFSLDLNMLPSVRVGDDGIDVKVFNFRWRWIHISWSQIKDVNELESTYRGYRIWCVSTDCALTTWHKVLSRKHCGQPTTKNLFLTGLLMNSDNLIEEIQGFTDLNLVEKE